jgi:hypothetical protein
VNRSVFLEDALGEILDRGGLRHVGDDGDFVSEVIYTGSTFYRQLDFGIHAAWS